MKLSVYGRLRSGESLHDIVLKPSIDKKKSSLITTMMLTEYTMYQIRDYPVVCKTKAGIIKVELYDIDDSLFSQIEYWKPKYVELTRVSDMIRDNSRGYSYFSKVYFWMHTIQPSEELSTFPIVSDGDWSKRTLEYSKDVEQLLPIK